MGNTAKKEGLDLDKVLEYLCIIVLGAVISIIGNYLYTRFDATPEEYHLISESLPGMMILMGIAFAGLIITDLVPWNVPSVVWITIIGILLGMPYSPTGAAVAEYVGKVEMLPLATPVLAYAGISMGKNWADFKKIGWRGILVGILVMCGTFLGSAIIAEIILKCQGII